MFGYVAPVIVTLAAMALAGGDGRLPGSTGALVRRDACTANDVEGCVRTAFLYWGERRGSQREGDNACEKAALIDGRRAVALNQAACDGGNLLGCRCLGRLYVRGKGVARNLSLAMSRLGRACDLGDATSCVLIGTLHVEGAFGAPDYAKAAPYYLKACDGGDGGACVRVAGCYRSGQGLPRDEAKALEFDDKACKAGEQTGCRSLEEAEAAARRSAPGALAANQRACAGGVARACRDLAWTYAKGEGVAKSPGEAQRLLDRACDLGDAAVCRDQGLMLTIGPVKDKPRGARYLEKGCLGGDPISCGRLGTMYMMGDGVPRDWKKGDELLKRESALRNAQGGGGP